VNEAVARATSISIETLKKCGTRLQLYNEIQRLVPHLGPNALPHGISEESKKDVLARTLITLRKSAFVANTELKDIFVEEAKNTCSATSKPEDREIELESSYHKFPNHVRTMEAFNESYILR
jgi:hypothetical protein